MAAERYRIKTSLNFELSHKAWQAYINASKKNEFLRQCIESSVHFEERLLKMEEVFLKRLDQLEERLKREVCSQQVSLVADKKPEKPMTDYREELCPTLDSFLNFSSGGENTD